MQIRAGYEISYECPKPTPMILMLSVHPSREADLIVPDRLILDPPVPASEYVDGFGNKCSRILAPAGRITISADLIIEDSGQPDEVEPNAKQHDLHHLPANALVYLLGSRYCETDKLLNTAWSLFHATPKGWPLVQRICDYVHEHLTFGYAHARPTKTAWEAFVEKKGVCRDFAHLAITLCRCMNVPARYCTGYLGDIGVLPVDEAMDFSAWFEVYLGRHWYTFDARHNQPRIGRVLMARGRDATDVAIVTSFGPCTMCGFKVVTDEVTAQQILTPRRASPSHG
jgi:transglutaminase-like putative cysteine protease